MTNCWKCGALYEESCDDCNPTLASEIEDIKQSISRAKTFSDNLGNGIDSFQAKLEKWKNEGAPKTLSVNRCIHMLCLLADDIEAIILAKKQASSTEIAELKEKALFIAELADQLALND